MAAAGISPQMLASKSAASSRESHRQWLHNSVSPVVSLVSQELRAKLFGLGADFSLSTKRINASDITGRARAYKQLVDAGMETRRAEEIVGFV